MYNVLIVGAGLSGAVLARELTNEGYKVLVLEQQETHGGNCMDFVKDGCIIHKCGIHVFHTNNYTVWNWISRYGEWRDFKFRAMLEHGNSDGIASWYSSPFNMHTFSKFFGVNTPEEARQVIKETTKNIDGDNAHAWCLRNIGEPLYEAFVRDQLIKHWGTDPINLPESYIKRIPLRYTYDTSYYYDSIEKMPRSYADLFDELLEGIEVRYNTQFTDNYDAPIIFYTGSIDALFNYGYGYLPYRSLDFDFMEAETLGTHMLRLDGKNRAYRMIDWGEVSRDLGYRPTKNIVSLETARDWIPGDIRMYPVRTDKSVTLFEQYRRKLPYKINPIGRLGSFQYMDMHQVIAQSLHAARKM